MHIKLSAIYKILGWHMRPISIWLQPFFMPLSSMHTNPYLAKTNLKISHYTCKSSNQLAFWICEASALAAPSIWNILTPLLCLANSLSSKISPNVEVRQRGKKHAHTHKNKDGSHDQIYINKKLFWPMLANVEAEKQVRRWFP